MPTSGAKRAKFSKGDRVIIDHLPKRVHPGSAMARARFVPGTVHNPPDSYMGRVPVEFDENVGSARGFGRTGKVGHCVWVMPSWLSKFRLRKTVKEVSPTGHTRAT